MSGGESNPPAGDGGKVERKELFISYSHKDRYFLEQFWVFLKPLEEDYGLQRWDDSRIKSGDNWRDEIQQALKRAQVAMLLVSPHFLASDFIRRVELPSLFEAAKHDGMKILWLPIRPCSWRRHPQFEQYQSVGSLDPTLAEMKKVNPSFDDVEIMANVQGVRTASSLHIAQARVAASRGDLQTVQAEITRAAAIWPNNPEIQSFSTDMTKVSEKASPQVQAVSDFDQLDSQHNYRQIFDDKEKYIAALAMDDSNKKSERKEKLRDVLSRMQEIETSIMRSQEIARRGDYAGAWEGIEVTFGHYPDDQKLGQLRADLTTQAPDFVHDIRQAKSDEEKKEYGSSLAWYLRSQSRYPMSDLSKQGIQRIVRLIMPDAS